MLKSTFMLKTINSLISSFYLAYMLRGPTMPKVLQAMIVVWTNCIMCECQLYVYILLCGQLLLILLIF